MRRQDYIRVLSSNYHLKTSSNIAYMSGHRHLHRLLGDAGRAEDSSEEDDHHQQLHQREVPVIANLELTWIQTCKRYLTSLPLAN